MYTVEINGWASRSETIVERMDSAVHIAMSFLATEIGSVTIYKGSPGDQVKLCMLSQDIYRTMRLCILDSDRG